MKTKLVIVLLMISTLISAQIDAEIQPLYDSFIADAANKGVTPDASYTIDMKFVYHNKHDYIGISVINNETQTANVLFKKHRWDTLTNVEKKIAVYHELGHVLLHRAHQDHNLSIMNAGSVTEAVYLANESQLLEELFKPYGNTTALFKAELGNFNDPIDLNTGDLILMSKGYGYPLKPFIVDIDDPDNEVYTLGDYQLWVISNVNLNDSTSLVRNGNKIIQIRSLNGGISLIQTDPAYQPSWDSNLKRTVFTNASYLKYHFNDVNTTFDDSPFKLPGVFKYSYLSGPVKIDSKVNQWTGKIVVLFYEKPYLTNYE